MSTITNIRKSYPRTVIRPLSQGAVQDRSLEPTVSAQQHLDTETPRTWVSQHAGTHFRSLTVERDGSTDLRSSRFDSNLDGQESEASALVNLEKAAQQVCVDHEFVLKAPSSHCCQNR